MCGSCWNADTFEEKVKKYGKEACDGSDMLFMTMDELKERLSMELASKNQTSYRIFNKAITDLPEDVKSLSFTPKTGVDPINITFV